MNILRILVLGSWLMSALIGGPRLQQIDPPLPEASDSTRLVVFEGFLRPG
jgi:hypothetical protein